MKKGMNLVLEDEQIVELMRILIDEDAEDALKFLKVRGSAGDRSYRLSGLEGRAADEAFRSDSRTLAGARRDPSGAATADADPRSGWTDARAEPHAVTPGPTPTPTPDSGAPPTGGSCSLPPSNNPNAPCSMQTPNFLGPVDKAITQLTQQQPGLFDFNNKLCENCYVKNEAAYVAGVIKNLNAAGICAYYDGEELAVKNSNSYNEQYDILISSGHIRRGGGSYRSTCNPSWF